jgi:hypothetical protein
MKSDKLIDTIIRYIEQKGIVTDESFLRRGQLFELFGVNMASVIKIRTDKGDRISGKNYLRSVVERDTYEQGSKFSYFTLAPAIMNKYDMFSEDGCKQFRQCQTEADLNNTVNCQVPSIPLFLTDGSRVKIKNNAIKRAMLQYIPVNPLLDPTFNYDYDEYPVDESIVNDILDFMFKTYQSKTAKQPLDTVSDSKETTQSIS